MNLTLPRLVMAGLLFTILLIAANEHGKERVNKRSFWTALIAVSIEFGILAWGDFWGPL